MAEREDGRLALSLITPFLNAEPFLEPCVTSVLGQTLWSLPGGAAYDVEWSFYDDGSTDSSVETLLTQVPRITAAGIAVVVSGYAFREPVRWPARADPSSITRGMDAVAAAQTAAVGVKHDIVATYSSSEAALAAVAAAGAAGAGKGGGGGRESAPRTDPASGSTWRRKHIGHARNRCISQTRGEWVCIVDADDVALPHRFATLLAHAAAVSRGAASHEPHCAQRPPLRSALRLLQSPAFAAAASSTSVAPAAAAGAGSYVGSESKAAETGPASPSPGSADPVTVSVATLTAAWSPSLWIVGSHFIRTPAGSTPRYAAFLNAIHSGREVLGYRMRDLSLVQPTWVFARTVWDCVGGYSEAVHDTYGPVPDDLWFFMRAVEVGTAVSLLPSPLVEYRYSGQSASHGISRQGMLALRVEHFERTVLGVTHPCHCASWDVCPWRGAIALGLSASDVAAAAVRADAERMGIAEVLAAVAAANRLPAPEAADGKSNTQRKREARLLQQAQRLAPETPAAGAVAAGSAAGPAPTSEGKSSSPTTSPGEGSAEPAWLAVARESPWRGWAFALWGAGRDGKKVYNALSDEGRLRVRCMHDIAPEKHGQLFGPDGVVVATGVASSPSTSLSQSLATSPLAVLGHLDPRSGRRVKRVVPIRDLSPAAVLPCVAVCVGLDGTDLELERRLDSMSLEHGIDYVHLV